MSVFQQGNTWLSAARQRAKQGIMQAMGSQSSSEDQEYEEKFRHFTAHTQELAKMKELMEIWVDSFDAFCKATSLLSEGWKQFHTSNPYYDGEENGTAVGGNSSKFPFSPIATQLDEISLCIDERLRPAILTTFQSRCLKPLSSILSLVPPIQEHHQIRKTLLTEFDSYRLKMEKEFAVGRDSTHPNVMRKAAKLDESAKKLHSEQSLLFQKFYEFETSRSQTLGPELGVYVSCLYSFASLMHNELSELLPFIPQSATSLATLDAANLNPPSSTVTVRLTKPAASVNIGAAKPHFPAEIIASRPISAGGSIGGYGTVVAQDYHHAAATPLMDTNNVVKAKDNDDDWPNELSPNVFMNSNSDSSRISRPFSEFSTPPSSTHPLDTSILTDTREIENVTEFSLHQDEGSSRPVSEITMGTFASARESLVTIIEQPSTLGASIDVCAPPPKPPRKDRQIPSASFPDISSNGEYLETVKEFDEENSLSNNTNNMSESISGSIE